MGNEERSAAVCFIVFVKVAQTADFAGSCVAAFIEMAVDDDTGTYSCTKGDSNYILVSASLTEMAFSEGEAVCVVVYIDRDAESLLKDLLQMHFLP